jgi:hypothetical protein
MRGIAVMVWIDNLSVEKGWIGRENRAMRGMIGELVKGVGDGFWEEGSERGNEEKRGAAML